MLAASIPFYEDPQTLFIIGLLLLVLFVWYFATEIERRKRNVGTVLLLGVTALCLVSVFPLKERLKGGIDILGGSSYSLRVQQHEDETTGEKTSVTKSQVEQAIKVIEQRLNGAGTSEPLIAAQGEDKILVQMPGVTPEEAKKIRETLERVAHLELRQVHPRSNELVGAIAANTEVAPPGYKVFQQKLKDSEGKTFTSPILLSRRVALGGPDVAHATPSPTQHDAVSITLNAKGGDKMIALTEHMQPGVDRIAIVLDNEVISAPSVKTVPLGSQFQIDGLDKPGEVQDLANALMNPLENGLKVEEERSVSPLLGAEIVKQGIWSGVLGLALTFLFVLVYYRVAGIVAIIGLILNTVMLFGIMAMFGFTFSLPGIAGMVLTIGVAVDANVLINERLREELAAGKSLKTAISAAYDKAFSAILDANVTSLITAIILFWLASSTVKGFAVTLTIGLLCSMFSAILATRVLFRWGVDLGILKKLSFLNLIQSKHFDFLGKRVTCVVASIVLTIISIGAFGWKKERAFGIDFTGGTRIQFLVGNEPISNVEAEKFLAEGNLNLHKAAYVQDETNPTSGHLLTVRCDSRDTDTVIAKLREHYPKLAEKTTDDKGQEIYKIASNHEEVSALIGSGLLMSSGMALALGLVGIFLYVWIRFEISFAVGAFVAIVHDCIISIGVVVLLGRELSLIHVGAILTIAGYSINDTIIIFDRIRENLRHSFGGHTLEEVMNEAINSTLSRTILTSTATLVSVLSLAILGGAALRDFSLVILIGIVVGTYSSIFVASPFVLWWSRGRNNQLRDDGIEAEVVTEAKPTTN
ncbi:protein translocase subunit SecD [Luteolibacter sp. LG18]|uniref:protein translocase subunit SecD n=1 Tax=Luteolibacter sp. LG18 TaxID=2819286 RepID=UPI002B2A5877|nr:protein translocase subunit SecDF [Luteolibacter sp. LG18]